MNLNVNRYKQMSFFKSELDHILEISKLSDGSNNAFLPTALQADLSSNDTLYYGQAIKVEDLEDFKSVIRKETNKLCKAEVLDIMLLKDKPRNCKLSKFICSFKYKRSPIRVLIKYKARLYVYGDM